MCPVPEVPQLSIPENTEQRLLDAGVADHIRSAKCPNQGDGKNVVMVVGDGMGALPLPVCSLATRRITPASTC